ncbi:hypothetical protein D1007_59762 [Hordeum vulgare]|nr:hypothetical protein D1007_59762 [Hordeum vulgare]
MSGFLRRPLVVCAVVCAATRSGLPRLGTPGSSPSLSSTPADANCVSVSLSMLPVAAMRSSVGADVVLNGTMMNSTQEERDDAHDSFLQGTQDQSNTPVSANDMCALDEWPSHARRNRAQLQDEAGGQKKKGRGVLKGFKASKKRFANGSAKLNIAFSETLGGTVGMNYCSFKDDVVVIMKRKLPLIGVRR